MKHRITHDKLTWLIRQDIQHLTKPPHPLSVRLDDAFDRAIMRTKLEKLAEQADRSNRDTADILEAWVKLRRTGAAVSPIWTVFLRYPLPHPGRKYVLKPAAPHLEPIRSVES
ncbi:hypothetical protein [Williamsia sterculiae]|uniref:Uncharacterized protein n=1 Tax=Williamsia sterculiae TaxID=1344003 RepID=A0A1N7HEH3_9NOCA|nr:hypothetical protein [Williamsia sterculiae]SIS23108.1 hypothetical protein SAMN05445060_4054 [Williamsia sterculiae]